MTKEPVKLADIAKETGLSVATVNRAIRGVGRVNPETRDKVLTKAAEMGYAPNMAASALSSKKTTKFAVICPDDFFFADVLAGVDAAVLELQGYGIEAVKFLSHEYKVSIQISQFEKVIESGAFCGILLAPAHPVLLNHMIEKAVDSGITVVTMNHDAPASKRTCFVGQNGWMVGSMCAQLYASLLPKGARVALFKCRTPALGLKLRTDGFEDYCRLNGQLEIVGSFEYDDSVPSAEELCDQVILSVKPDAVFANNMMGSIGCALSARKATSKHPFMMGFDINDQICELIQDGTLYLTMLQDPFSQGYYSYKSLYRRYTNPASSQAEVHYTHTDIVMASNLDEYCGGRFVEYKNVFK